MKKEEIKVIAFDMGGVLVGELKDFGGYEAIARDLHLCPDKFLRARQKYFRQALVGEESSKRYINDIADELGVSPVSLEKNWTLELKKVMKQNKLLYSKLNKLKKNYLLGILTNVTDHNEKFREKLGLYKPFHFKVSSLNAKTRKPFLKIYNLFIKKSKCKPSEIVFIDDYQKNLVPAQKTGMHTIHFKNNKQLFKQLKKLGVRI